jgi:DNA mismatch endonuclease (patch repair protein)
MVDKKSCVCDMLNFKIVLFKHNMTKKSIHTSTPETAQQRVSRLMKANKSKGTKPELFLRKALWNSGTRGYRLHLKNVPGRPDIAFPSKRLAVFVHGCFWHQCPHCEGKKAYPRSNQEFWRAKFAENATRDVRVKEQLLALGWRSLVLWECEVLRDTAACVHRVGADLSHKG